MKKETTKIEGPDFRDKNNEGKMRGNIIKGTNVRKARKVNTQTSKHRKPQTEENRTRKERE